MRVGIVAPPFIAVPPLRYGGTELFIAHLARQLYASGHDVVVYANGDSMLPCQLKWRYPHTEWPLDDGVRAQLKNADHTAWAIHDAAASVDVLHLNDAVAVPFTRFTDVPCVQTLHHPHEPVLSEQYTRYPGVQYVAIAEWLAQREPMPRVHVIHHGIPLDDYRFSAAKDEYVVFLGRMAPCKGPHLAVEAALRAGIPLKLAGEIQPTFMDYWETMVRPRIDGRDVEYIGEVNLAQKNDVLSRARALLFPIQWEEPFGLVLVEAMACGTPVLAFAGGAVTEIVTHGVTGWICEDVDDMSRRMTNLNISSQACRTSVDRQFSVERMTSDYVRVYQNAMGLPEPVAQAMEA